MLYIASTALIVIGLLCAIGEWYEKQTMSSIYGSMIIQVVGVFEYFSCKSNIKRKFIFLCEMVKYNYNCFYIQYLGLRVIYLS